MANCPSCGIKLHLYNWKPNCPNCKVNLNYYKANELLLEESEKTEIEHAKFQPKVDRGKASYFGSKLTVIRLALSVIPLGALFLPLFNAGKNISALDIYKSISKNSSDFINGITKGAPYYIAMAILLISAVMVLVNTFFLIGSLGKHGKVRNIILSSVNCCLAVTYTVLMSVSAQCASIKIGSYLYIALLLAIVIINIIIAKKGIPFNYTLCLIGGLPSDVYFRYVEEGLSEQQIRRKMLIALAELQEEANKRLGERENKKDNEDGKGDN